MTDRRLVPAGFAKTLEAFASKGASPTKKADARLPPAHGKDRTSGNYQNQAISPLRRNIVEDMRRAARRFATHAEKSTAGLVVETGAPDPIGPQARAAAASVGRIFINGIGVGTGWLCGPSMLVTAYHVLSEVAGGSAESSSVAAHAVGALVAFATGERVVQQLWFGDSALDLAMLKLEPGEPSAWLDIELAGTAASDSPIAVIHCPDLEILLCSEASVILECHGSEIWHTADTDDGSSGAPIFNAEWKVCGVHLAGATTQELSDAALRKLIDSGEKDNAFNIARSIDVLADVIRDARALASSAS